MVSPDSVVSVCAFTSAPVTKVFVLNSTPVRSAGRLSTCSLVHTNDGPGPTWWGGRNWQAHRQVPEVPMLELVAVPVLTCGGASSILQEVSVQMHGAMIQHA